MPRPAANLSRPPPPPHNPPNSTVPTAPIPVPDNWTPAVSGRDRTPVVATHTQEFHDGGFYDGDGPATEIERDEHGFPQQPDVPSTVVSEEEGQGGHRAHRRGGHDAFANSFDEVPPSQAMSALPNDAPTVVRPDLAGMAADASDDTMGSHLESVPNTTADAMQAYADQPAGEPTVALPPPSKRKKTSVKQPSPEPAPESLPSGASYSPPADTPPPAKKARSEKRPDTRKRDKSRGDKKKRDKKSPPSSRSVKKPPAPGRKKSRSDRSEGKKKLPKNASVVGEEPSGGIPMLYYVYGGVGVAGIALVAGAVVVAVIILAVTSA